MGYEAVLVQLLMALGLALIVGKAFEELFARIRYPPILGDLVAGVLLGTVFNIFPKGEAVDAFAWFGVTLLLFYAGLETRYGEFMKSIRRAGLVTIGEALAAFGLGTLVGLAMGYSLVSSLFLGTILEATSVSLTVRTLMDLGKLRSLEGTAILAIAVLDDISSLLTIAVVTSFALLHQIEIINAIQIAALALGFWVGVVFLFHKVNNRIVKFSRKLRITEPTLTVLLGIFALLAVTAKDFRVSPLIAAYAIGLAFSDARGIQQAVDKIKSMAVVFSTMFFVNSAARIDFLTALKPEYAVFYALMIAAAFAGKLLGGGLTSFIVGYSKWSALRIAAGLFPRAEFCIIAAVAGQSLGVIGPEAYFSAILIVLITNFAAPPLLKLVFSHGPPSALRSWKLISLKRKGVG